MKTIESPEKPEEKDQKINESVDEKEPCEPKRVLEKTPIISRKLTEY